MTRKQTLKKDLKQQSRKPSQTNHCVGVGFGFVGFLLVAVISFCVFIAITGIMEKLASHVLSYTSRFILSLCSVTEFPMPLLLVIIVYLQEDGDLL